MTTIERTPGALYLAAMREALRLIDESIEARGKCVKCQSEWALVAYLSGVADDYTATDWDATYSGRDKNGHAWCVTLEKEGG